MDIYSFDETGFRIGCINGRIVITHTNTKHVYLTDPNNRDFITSMECIWSDGSAIQPMIVLKGSVFLEKHFDNNMDNGVLFAQSNTGYSNDKLGIIWLSHFNSQTINRTKGKYRLLVFDGRGSHLSGDFLVYCWQWDIIPFLLPSQYPLTSATRR